MAWLGSVVGAREAVTSSAISWGSRKDGCSRAAAAAATERFVESMLASGGPGRGREIWAASVGLGSCAASCRASEEPGVHVDETSGSAKGYKDW